MLLLAEQLYEQCNVDRYSFLVTEFWSSMILSMINRHWSFGSIYAGLRGETIKWA
jgi:hypothetical protein